MGFIIGFPLSFALLPPVDDDDDEMSDDERARSQTKRIIQIVVCLVSVVSIITILFIVLYKVPIYDYQLLKYLDCVPLTSDWCANQDIQINRVDIL